MKTLRLVAICSIIQLAALAQPGPAPLLEINGDILHPRTFQEREWEQLKHTTVSATNAHEKKTARYGGVPLRDLLREAGVPSGDGLRGKALTTCVVISAVDGYQVTFSIAELDESIGNLQVLVADSEDGKPLPRAAGPLRLIVPTDKRPARWVRMVKTIRVVASPSAASPR
ncbi:MAG TPA: molybdopterin-dependent oxidoreductase [Candidatus Angelobacter sp.]|jgi:DMSO/TMAO reductase YedYZ molybdopterin-dependent catalytic subunit|nr:molybdopterin-dependent oxidoreductase [Candidatus Angelobacter sp.]